MSYSFPPTEGGTERYLQQLCSFFSHRGHDLTVLTLRDSLITESNRNTSNKFGVRNGMYSIKQFQNLLPMKGFHISPSLQWYYYRHRFDFDLTLVSSYSSFLGLEVAPFSFPPIVFVPQYHGTLSDSSFRSIVHLPFRRLASLLIRRARKIVCMSNFERNRFLNDFPLAMSKVLVIREGVETIKCSGQTRTRNRILIVSRLEEYKGIQYVLRAMKYMPESYLDIVGEGGYRPDLERVCEYMGIRSRVTFHGHVSDQELVELYCRGGVFVSLSRFEAYGISVAQALSAGMPCVVLKGSALEDWINQDSCYGVNDPNDSYSVANAISRARLLEPQVQVPSNEEHFLKLEELLKEVNESRL